jgi:hypothetical protein
VTSLWEQLGSPSEFLQIPYGQCRFYMFRGELNLSQRLDDDLLSLSHQRNDSTGLVLGHYSSGSSLMFAGGFASSRSHLEGTLAIYASISDRSLVQRAAVHPQVTAQSFLGIASSVLGIPTKQWHAVAQRSLRPRASGVFGDGIGIGGETTSV